MDQLKHFWYLIYVGNGNSKSTDVTEDANKNF